MHYRGKIILVPLLLGTIAGGAHATTADLSPYGGIGSSEGIPLLVSQAVSTTSPAAAGANQPPKSKEYTSDEDLFGPKGGYVHPFISLGVEYTDNLFNIAENQKSSFIGRVTPGIWFSLPRTKDVPITINPNNTSPGGLRLQLNDYSGTGRYQAYGLAGITYKSYSEDSKLNDWHGRLEGLFRYNMKGGLSLQVLDRFSYSEDMFDVGTVVREELRRYSSNIFVGTADYRITEKVRAKGEYSNFHLDYKENDLGFLDRTDNFFDFYGFYSYSLKTSFFFNYRYGDIVYDTIGGKDNQQHYGYLGLTWDTTEKLSLLFKGGYQQRLYENEAVAQNYDRDDFVFDLQATYRWTEKTQFILDMYSKSEESNYYLAVSKRVLGARLSYRQRFSYRLSGSIDLYYEGADFDVVQDRERDDARFIFRPALQYHFREWAYAELAYRYDTRDSTDNLFDYTTNAVILNFNFSF
jgi:hypothetical protein